jgi:acetyl-CoA carboxylase carboxyltransferase component
LEAANAELRRRRHLGTDAGRPERVRRQHERGGLTGHERIELLLDPGSFLPMGRLVHAEDLADADRTLGGDGVIHGFGLVDGRPVAVHASDPTVKGATGSTLVYRVSSAHERIAERCGLPLFDLHQSGGARITDIMSSRFAGQGGAGMGSRHAFGGRPLLLTAVLGDYYPPWNIVQADFSAMNAHAHAALTSPALLEVATGQQVTAEELGGAKVQSSTTGQVDAVGADEPATLALLRDVFSYLPAVPGGPPIQGPTGDPADRADPELREILPENPRGSFDMRKIVRRVCDRDSFLEWAPSYAPALLTGLARLAGRSVAVIANQPRMLAGTIDVRGLIKLRRICELAGRFELPLVSFLDTPGVLTTREQEHARLISEVYRTNVERLRPAIPKVAVVVRKGIGFALFAMGASDPEGLTLAWPSARIAFTGPEPAARIVHAREIAAADDPAEAMRARADEMRALSAPWEGVGLGYIDALIDPAETRPVIIRAIAALERRRRE